MRCDEARRRLMDDAGDREACRHLEGCAACFEVLESADPLVVALRAARPAEEPGPAGVAGEVLARWRPRRARALPALRGALVASALAIAVAIELLVGAEPARLAGLGPAFDALTDALEGALTTLVVVRTILIDAPLVLTGFSALTLAVCALWLRLALRVPTWRAAR